MSHKQAKLLRKYIGYKVNAEPVEYNDKVVKTVMVDTGKIGVDGKPVYLPEVRINRTCKGMRKVYRECKREMGV